VRVSSGISFETATAAPVLDFWMLYKVMKESPITIVLIAPKRKRNSLWSKFLAALSPITAACDAPNPGRKAVNGLAIIEASPAFAIDFFFNLIFLIGIILCFGIFIFCFMLMIRLLAPNKPVRRGRRGSFMFRFREAIPKNPAIRKMIKAQSFFEVCFSEKIR